MWGFKSPLAHWTGVYLAVVPMLIDNFRTSWLPFFDGWARSNQVGRQNGTLGNLRR
jgi:hypothetical protein